MITMRIISISNAKGGVGKTTLTVNLAYELQRLGYVVLLIDLDDQCDLTKIYRPSGNNTPDILCVLNGQNHIADAYVEAVPNLYLIPGSRNLAHFKFTQNEQYLRQLLMDDVFKEVDFILIDHPPTLNDATLAGYIASDEVLIVTDPEAFSVQNLDQLLDNLQGIKARMNPNLNDRKIKRIKPLQDELTSLQSRIEEVQTKKLRYMELYELDQFDTKLFSDRLTELESDLDRFHAKRSEIEFQLNDDNFIDTILASDADYLFCDDFGNEFADFISIKNSKSICYYHAKYATSQLSASNFQEVIGQALKNIGNMNPSSAQLDIKKTRWSAYYTGSAIPLIRRGDSVENGVHNFTRTLNHPNSINHIYIVVNYLSKTRVLAELNALKEGRPTPAQTIQLFWILSSFISTCKELGFQAHITCKP